MKRLVDHFLHTWKTSPLRQPLIVRGARQVGKTHTVRAFGKTFSSCVEINLELRPEFKEIFETNLDPHIISRKISVIADQPIIPGQTLLFIDEIQAVPNAIIALRYFYEMMPELHVIAAGSLLDFAIQQVGMPVGRVASFYMYPLSFIEFLSAMNAGISIDEILSHDITSEIAPIIHNKFLDLVGQYLAIGGMPQAVACWQNMQDLYACADIPFRLIDTYKQDFNKYAKEHQLHYLEVLFKHIPRLLGKKFKFSVLGEDIRKRELAPCLDLLVTANIVHKVFHSGAHGIPIGADSDLGKFKVLCIDVALSQFMLDLNVGDWLLNPLEAFVNKGELVEAFVGQELLAYTHPRAKGQLYYWQREVRDSEAEVDYVIQQKSQIIPVEVKSGKGTTLKSMNLFLDAHPQSPYGIRFSSNNYSVHEKVHSYPLYAVAKVMAESDPEVKKALLGLR